MADQAADLPREVAAFALLTLVAALAEIMAVAVLAAERLPVEVEPLLGALSPPASSSSSINAPPASAVPA
jgi:hypothetical protein